MSTVFDPRSEQPWETDGLGRLSGPTVTCRCGRPFEPKDSEHRLCAACQYEQNVQGERPARELSAEESAVVAIIERRLAVQSKPSRAAGRLFSNARHQTKKAGATAPRERAAPSSARMARHSVPSRAR